MECPYCKKEMREGRIPADREAVCWYDMNKEFPYADGIPLSATPYFEPKFAAAHYCSDCRIVIVPVPTAEEIEGPMAKLKKKWNAKEEQRAQEREQRQAEKDAEKKQQNREKSRKKDPWEV